MKSRFWMSTPVPGQRTPRFEDLEITALAPKVIAPGEATGPGAAPTHRSRFEGSDPGQIAGLALHDVSLDARLPVSEMGRVCGAEATDLGTLVDQAARKGARHRLYDSAPERLRRPLRSSARPNFTNSCAMACRQMNTAVRRRTVPVKW